MTNELAAQVEPPSNRNSRRTIYTAICTSLLGATLGAGTVLLTVRSPRDHIIVFPVVVDGTPVPVPATVAEPLPPPAPTRDLELPLIVTIDGESYMQLSTNVPKYGRPQLHASVARDGIVAAIAPVAERDVPEPARAWKRRGVVVDSSCETRVIDFVVIARVNGTNGPGPWVAETVLADGAPILAGRLEGCSGTYARDALLRDVALLDEEPDAALESRARAVFFASAPVQDAQREWESTGAEDPWYREVSATITTRVMRHRLTKVVWVSVHAYKPGDNCGELSGNVWGLFRVEPNGDLDPVQLRAAKLDQIDHFIDLEADGVPEIIGTSGTTVTLERATGETLDSLGVTELGQDLSCGCSPP